MITTVGAGAAWGLPVVANKPVKFLCNLNPYNGSSVRPDCVSGVSCAQVLHMILLHLQLLMMSTLHPLPRSFSCDKLEATSSCSVGHSKVCVIAWLTPGKAPAGGGPCGG